MSEVIREDIIQQGLDRLPFEPWHDKPVVMGLLESLLTPLQEVEDLLHQINDEYSIDVALGKQLDIYGELFQEPRNGRFDEEYRSAIKGRITGQLSSGTAPDIKTTAKNVTKADLCNIFEHFPGAAYVFVNQPVSYSSAQAIENSAMCGVRTRTSWVDTDEYFIPAAFRGVYSTNMVNEDGEIFLVDTPEGEFELVVDIDRYFIPTGDLVSGFTSLVPGATTYEVVDGRGKLVAPSSLPVDTLSTGYILDNNGNYIVDNYGNNIRYITYS